MKKILITILMLCAFISFGFAQQKASAHKSGLPLPGTTDYVLTWDGLKAIWAAGVSADSAWNIITLGSDVENVDGKIVFIDASGGTGDVEISSGVLVFSGFSGYTFDNTALIEDDVGTIILRKKIASVVADAEIGAVDFFHLDPNISGRIARIVAHAQSTVTGAGDNDSYLVFSTISANSLTEKMRIDKVGNIFGVAGYNFYTDSSSVSDAWGFVDTRIAALVTGLSIYVQIAVVNTDGATLQINALGAKAVHKQHNVALATGDVEVGQILHLIYDGTEFQMLSQLAQ